MASPQVKKGSDSIINYFAISQFPAAAAAAVAGVQTRTKGRRRRWLAWGWPAVPSAFPGRDSKYVQYRAKVTSMAEGRDSGSSSTSVVSTFQFQSWTDSPILGQLPYVNLSNFQ